MACSTSARSVVRELRERRAALGQLDRDRDDHAAAVQTQLGRLGIVEAISVSATTDSDNCPACGAELDEPDETLAVLAQDSAQLDTQLRALSAATRDIGPAERELDAAIAAAQNRYSEIRQRLDAALATDAAVARLADEGQVRARLLGVIEEYLRSATAASPAARAELVDRVRTLSEELAAVEPGTDRASIDDELEARLGAMSVDMTAWARELDLEAAEEGNVYIDRRTLNVAIGTSHGRVGLAQMGSGANHVGYHLVAHLALHQHFVRENRPVPRFVVFDQPSLPFFPTNVVDRDAAIADVDWEAVRTMMLLADRVVRDLGGELQVMITDHASFATEDWFDDALVEDWHTGTKLVPADWPER
jgi:DNA repair exonuclease SbcCD ATPase subunit